MKKGDFNGKSVAVKCLKDSSAAQTFLNEASLMTYVEQYYDFVLAVYPLTIEFLEIYKTFQLL